MCECVSVCEWEREGEGGKIMQRISTRGTILRSWEERNRRESAGETTNVKRSK